MSTFRALSRVTLKNYSKITGRIRHIDYDVEDKTRGTRTSVAHVWWQDGRMSKCPLDRLELLPFFAEARYPWEKNKDDDEDAHIDPEVEAGKHDG
jgi:hypothetical protein